MFNPLLADLEAVLKAHSVKFTEAVMDHLRDLIDCIDEEENDPSIYSSADADDD